MTGDTKSGFSQQDLQTNSTSPRGKATERVKFGVGATIEATIYASKQI